jgi:hypothetical protein
MELVIAETKPTCSPKCGCALLAGVLFRGSDSCPDVLFISIQLEDWLSGKTGEGNAGFIRDPRLEIDLLVWNTRLEVSPNFQRPLEYKQ